MTIKLLGYTIFMIVIGKPLYLQIKTVSRKDETSRLPRSIHKKRYVHVCTSILKTLIQLCLKNNDRSTRLNCPTDQGTPISIVKSTTFVCNSFEIEWLVLKIDAGIWSWRCMSTLARRSCYEVQRVREC